MLTVRKEVAPKASNTEWAVWTLIQTIWEALTFKTAFLFRKRRGCSLNRNTKTRCSRRSTTKLGCIQSHLDRHGAIQQNDLKKELKRPTTLIRRLWNLNRTYKNTCIFKVHKSYNQIQIIKKLIILKINKSKHNSALIADQVTNHSINP